jgi:hypothetical protein
MSRLAIVDRAKLRVIDVERRRATDISALSDNRLANRQPVWSPDGARLAWSAFDRRQTDSPASLSIATPEATWHVEHPAVFPPFYLAWRPDGAAVAALAEGPLGLELSVTDVASGACEIIHRGAPLFFDWSSEGALAIHTGTGDSARLDVHGAGYDRDAFSALTPGAFNAPAFLPSGDLLAVVVHHGQPVLAVIDRNATVLRVVTTAEFGSRFTVDPSGEWVAATSGRGATGAFVVHHLPTDSMSFVDERAPALFSWSAETAGLLFARIIDRGDFPILEWCTWQHGEVRAHVSARITATFAREVLPFHEQYARSHSWWSPEGTKFCYGAVDNYGNDTIWVVDVAKSRTDRVATGSLAVWSPR